MGWPIGAALGAAAITAGGSLLGGAFQTKSREWESDREYRRQKKFQQNKIQWLKADAEAAGISPLAAMGMQGGYSPQHAVGSDYGLSAASQAIGKSLYNLRVQREKEALKTQKISNEILATKAKGLKIDERGQIIPWQYGMNPLSFRGRGKVNVIKPEQYASNKGGIKAGTHPTFTWNPRPYGNGEILNLSRGENATGIEEDPYALASDIKYLYDLKRRSDRDWETT